MPNIVHSGAQCIFFNCKCSFKLHNNIKIYFKMYFSDKMQNADADGLAY